MGNQIVVTFDKPWNVSLEEGVRFDPKCPDPDVKLDVYYPNDKFKGGKKPYPCILLIHGGGWSMGNEKKFAMMAAYMASKGYVVACISYRLWPEYDWDCALFDAKRALAWLKKNASRYFGDPEKIGVVAARREGSCLCSSRRQPGLSGAPISLRELTIPSRRASPWPQAAT